MKRKRLKRNFYTQPTATVATQLLAKYIVRKLANGTVLEGKIVEVEMYRGANDKASHAYGGNITPRNAAEWMQGGHVYIYLVYGMYWQLNISTYKKGEPECVLIRAIATKGTLQETNGPGKLCRWLELDNSFYGEDLTKSDRLWLKDQGELVNAKEIVATPRIGIDYAGAYWASRKWRFFLKEYQPYLPKPKPYSFSATKEKHTNTNLRV